MEKFLVILLSFLIILNAWHDFKMQKVYFLLIVLQFIVTIILALLINSISIFLSYVTINSLFIALLASISLLVFKFIMRHNKPALNSIIGLGDIILIMSMICMFSPLNFIVFFILSLASSLVFYLVSNLKTNNKKTIPLIGTVGVQLAILLVVAFSTNSYFMYDDTYLLTLIK